MISSHAKNAQKDRLAARRAVGLLEKMKKLSVTFPHLSPTIFTYNAVMEAYCNQVTKNHNMSGGQQRLLDDQQVMLSLYQELQEAGLLPNTYTRNMILSSIPTDSEEWGRLESWAYDYLDDNGDTIIPDRKTYNILLKIYSVDGNFDKAETMLRRLLKWNNLQQQQQQRLEDITHTALKPSKIWFHCVLKALAVSDPDCDESDERIKHLLEEMKGLVNSGHADLQPDTSTYNHVLNVYAKYGNFNSAIDLMETMEESSEESERLDCISYTTVIKAYATVQKKIPKGETQSSIEIAEKATEIFERMRSRSIPPNILTCKLIEYL